MSSQAEMRALVRSKLSLYLSGRLTHHQGHRSESLVEVVEDGQYDPVSIAIVPLQVRRLSGG